MKVNDRVVLITGGSKGLGLALARELARSGAKVAIVARHEEALETARASLAKEGLYVLTIAADVADKQAVYPLLGRVQGTLGPIDIVVHNASTLGQTPLQPLLDTPCEVLTSTLETNVVGPLRITKALVPAMVLRGGGTVLHVSSDAAINAYPTWGAYGTSKAALDHLARHLAAELAGTGIRILSVDPGEMDTEMHKAALPDADPAALARPEEVARRIMRLLTEPHAHANGARVVAAEIGVTP